MSDSAKKKMAEIVSKLNGLPKETADGVMEVFSARMEGYAEGFEAGKAYKEVEDAQNQAVR